MCIAGKRAEGFEDPNSDEAKQFRVFLFALAKTFVHELAHVFVTFLGRGKTDTPPDVHILLDATTGEAGWYLEKLIFGGVISVYRNDAEYKEQVCSNLPALVDNIAYELIHPPGRHMCPD